MSFLCYCLFLLKFNNTEGVFPCEIQWDDAKDTERAVYQAPEKGNTSDRPADQRHRNDENARNHPKVDNPNIFHRVTKRTDECNRNDNVGKRKPVSSIEQEWILTTRFRNPTLNK